jgi:TatD DNase family protein
MEYIDSHCHPHFDNYDADRAEVLHRSAEAGVKRMIAVGCSLADSKNALDFAASHNGVWATVGAHPHDGQDFLEDKESIKTMTDLLARDKVVAVGEIGLDYFHEYTPKTDQQKILRSQLELGLESGLPFVFHVREAWDDFWPIFDDYSGLRGVIHSFSAAPNQLDEVLSRGLHIGLNGLLTYTKQEQWREAARQAPLDRILLETDAPFLTPIPDRGKRCEPKHTAITAGFLSELRGEDLARIADQTTKNTVGLFGLSDERLSE